MNKIFLLLVGIGLASCAGSNYVVPKKIVRTKSVTTLPKKNTNVGVKQNVEPKAQDKGAALLNQLFNSNPNDSDMVLIINNNSDCDFVMNIAGVQNYNVPVAAKKSESVIVAKGDYVLRSNVCNSVYLSRKKLFENTEVNIKHSVVKSAN